MQEAMSEQMSINIDDVSNDENQIRQHIYSMLASLLRQAPNKDTLDWFSSLEIDGDEKLRGMPGVLGLLKLTANKAEPLDVVEEFQLLFIGVGCGEIVPFASWYLTGSLMDLPLVSLRQDLRTLGYERHETTKEPEDHIAALLEVMAMLLEDNELQQQKVFFNSHIAPWFQRLCSDMKAAESARFYCAVAEVVNTFLSIEKNRFIPR